MLMWLTCSRVADGLPCSCALQPHLHSDALVETLKCPGFKWSSPGTLKVKFQHPCHPGASEKHSQMLGLSIIRFQRNNRVKFKNMPKYSGSKVRDINYFQKKQKYFLFSLVLSPFIKSSFFQFQSCTDTEGTLTTLA